MAKRKMTPTPAENIAKQIMETYKPQSAQEIQDVVKQIFAPIFEAALQGEMDNHLGYANHERSEQDSSNSRNGFSTKKLKTSMGEVPIRIPRDRESSFNPQIVKKHQRDVSAIEDKVLAMYARGMPSLGISFGIVPFTNVGYSYSRTDVASSSLYSIETHSGNGGLREVYVGAGWEPVKGFSVGVNAGYLWGNTERSITNTTNQSAANTLSRIYSTSVNTYKLDFGAQYQQALGKKDVLTIGATFGLGHKMGGEAQLINTNTDTQNSAMTSDTATIDDAFKLPMTLGLGFAWCHNKTLTVGADYSFQRWSNIDYPKYENNKYQLVSGLLNNRHKMTVGLDWIPSASNWTSLSLKNLLTHTHYRFGASYATPYYKVNGQDGPKELSVSAGMGIPLVNKWGNRSVLNISVQWARQSATNLITENTFRINLGITFNEKWFAKWKVE